MSNEWIVASTKKHGDLILLGQFVICCECFEVCQEIDALWKQCKIILNERNKYIWALLKVDMEFQIWIEKFGIFEEHD